jgi:hypothetical protein
MALFSHVNPFDKEWNALEREEKRFLDKRRGSHGSKLNDLLEDKVPDSLRSTLDSAFTTAFKTIFKRGTWLIDKTYHEDDSRRTYATNAQAAKKRPIHRNLKQFSKRARAKGNQNTAVSTAAGIGMGVLGIGIPDIAVLTGTMLRSVYQIALQYGFDHRDEMERYFILLIIEAAFSHDRHLDDINETVNEFCSSPAIPVDYDIDTHIRSTAQSMSDEMLYMKFLQGMPIIGVVGGAYDAVYTRNLATYANLKYRRRFLLQRLHKSMVSSH